MIDETRTMAFASKTPAADVSRASLPATPVFLTGFARSGTTWASRLLRDYLDIGFVNEGQFILHYGLRLEHYGNLRQESRRQRLLYDLGKDDFFAILKRNYGVRVDWTRVMASSIDFRTIVMDLLHQIAEQTGKTRIGSKYPVFGRHLHLLNALFPDARVVHIIRDGRDCALSHKNITWGHQNACAAAIHWHDYIRKARNGARDMSGRYLEMRYEDLIAHPESSMTALEKFITGTAPGPATAQFMAHTELLRTDKPVRWRHAMSMRDQAIFEGIAGDTLEACGYPLTGSARTPSALMRGVYATHDQLTREAWHWARKLFPRIPESRR